MVRGDHDGTEILGIRLVQPHAIAAIVVAGRIPVYELQRPPIALLRCLGRASRWQCMIDHVVQMREHADPDVPGARELLSHVHMDGFARDLRHQLRIDLSDAVLLQV